MQRPGGLPHVTFTFDDGPDPIWTRRILDALRRVEARAIFFVLGPAAGASPLLVYDMLDEGHEVALHCDRHIRHSLRTRRGVEMDTERGLAVLDRLGVRPTLWRPPWGERTEVTEDVAEKFGLSLVGWTEDTHDWRGDSAEAMLRSVSPTLSEGSVVLMHDGFGPGARRRDAAQTEALIGSLAALSRQRGLGIGAAVVSA